MSAVKDPWDRGGKYMNKMRNVKSPFNYFFAFHDYTIVILTSLASDKEKYSIDVGCHCGMFTGIIARASKKVIAIDPNPIVAGFKRHYNHWWCEPCRGKTIFICSAVSDSPGIGTYREYVGVDGSDQSPWNSLLDNPLGNKNLVETNSFNVNVERLDDLIPSSHSIGFLKIDVEGLNISAIKSGWELVKRNRPVILLETGYTPDITIVQELNDLNYDVWPIGRPLADPVCDVSKNLQNILAIPREYDLNKRNEIINSLNRFTNFMEALIDNGFDFERDQPVVIEWISDFLKSRNIF
jgi:FkbM family methyltransferase